MRRWPHVTVLSLLLWSVLAVIACSRAETRMLSGHSVTILFPAEGTPGFPTLFWETRLEMDDAAGLKAEAAEIWRQFRETEPRLAKASSVAMSAKEILGAGVARKPRSWHFVVRRNEDGTWPSAPEGSLAGS